MAGFHMEKRLEDFDMSFQPSLDPAVMSVISPHCGSSTMPRTLSSLALLVWGRRILPLVLAMRRSAGVQVYFANASHLMERLIKAKFENKLEERIKGPTKFHLLIVEKWVTCRSIVKVYIAFFNLIS